MNAESNAPSFFFVQISDTHWGSRDGASLTKQVVELINELPFKVECVVHTGDITADQALNSGTIGEGLAEMAKLRTPVFYVPGNHDICWTNVEPTVSVFTNRFGPLLAATNICGVSFLFTFVEPVVAKYRVEGYYPERWLTGKLDDPANKQAIVFMHTPPVRDFHNNAFFDVWPEESRTKWIQLLDRSNVVAVVTGHFHRDELHWAGRVPVFVGAPIARYWGRQPSFRVYEYANGRLSYRTIYVEKKTEKK